MKKNFVYALIGAIALTGATGFTSCTDEDVVDVNPGYNPETGEVPVSFVFNVATGNTPTTRMSQADVQATSTDVFRGMEVSHLMSYRLTEDGKYVTTADEAHKQYGLGPILGAGAVGPDSKTKSHRILELSLPVGTNTLMFWGKAARGTTSTDNTVGKINFKVEKNIVNNAFSLCPRVPEGTTTTEFNTTTSVVGYIRFSLASQERKSKNPSNTVTVPEVIFFVNSPSVSMVVMYPFVVDLNPLGDLSA